MPLKDYLSNSLEAKLARHLRAMRDDPFFPEVVWGIVKHFQTEDGNYYRAFVKAGTRNINDPDHEIWKSQKNFQENVVEKELLDELKTAAERFNLSFYVMEPNPECPLEYIVKETIKRNWLTETNWP